MARGSTIDGVAKNEPSTRSLGPRGTQNRVWGSRHRHRATRK
jgi:hypothetical protein